MTVSGATTPSPAEASAEVSAGVSPDGHGGGHAEALIEVRDVWRTFTQGDLAVDVLRGVTFSIRPGEFVAIQGTSGSGKSTLLHILGLLDRPTSGVYRLAGEDTSTLDDDALSHRRNSLTGFVFQNFYLIPYATALENVLLPGMYADTPLRQLRQRAAELLDIVGLGDRMDFTPARLSGGQQQRVALARALLNDPALVLADEPTGQLDSATSAEILALLGRINKAGKTVVVVTHDAATAACARRRIFIRDGVIESDAPITPTAQDMGTPLKGGAGGAGEAASDSCGAEASVRGSAAGESA